MDIKKRISRNLKRLRHEKGWSQEELADRANLHRTYISGVERGIRNATAVSLDKIASALGVTIGVLTDP